MFFFQVITTGAMRIAGARTPAVVAPRVKA
jgi:hypothetical protein